MRINKSTWDKYIDRLARLNQAAADFMQSWIAENGLEDLERAVRVVEALVNYYGEASAEASCQMYDAIAEKQNAKVAPAEPAKPAGRNYIDAVVRGEALMPDNIVAAVGRMVKQAGADTMLQNAKRDGAYFAWVPSGDTCAFCLVIASNGWRRASEKTIKGNHAEHIHNNCNCAFVIDFKGDMQIEGYDPDYYRKMYEEAEGNTPEEKINSIRRRQSNARKNLTKSLDVDDYNAFMYNKPINEDVKQEILRVIQSREKQDGFWISEISGQVEPDPEGGTPLFQITMTPFGLTQLNINVDYLRGKTLDEINQALRRNELNLARNIEEAIIHEAGHARSIKGLKPSEVTKLYKELWKIKKKGISQIALKDGAEALAELEILRARGVQVSDELKEFYKKYMKRDY